MPCRSVRPLIRHYQPPSFLLWCLSLLYLLLLLILLALFDDLMSFSSLSFSYISATNSLSHDMYDGVNSFCFILATNSHLSPSSCSPVVVLCPSPSFQLPPITPINSPYLSFTHLKCPPPPLPPPQPALLTNEQLCS